MHAHKHGSSIHHLACSRLQPPPPLACFTSPPQASTPSTAGRPARFAICEHSLVVVVAVVVGDISHRMHGSDTLAAVSSGISRKRGQLRIFLHVVTGSSA